MSSLGRRRKWVSLDRFCMARRCSVLSRGSCIDTLTDWYGWMFVLRRPYIPAANSRCGLLAAHTAVPSDAWTASSDPWPKAIGAPTRPTDMPKSRPLGADSNLLTSNYYFMLLGRPRLLFCPNTG